MSMLFEHTAPTTPASRSLLSFLWLEITGKCNLACDHCYASSSPQGNHGSMHTQDWERVISQASAMGCRNIQFIGGEPTVHPDLTHLIQFASERDMRIEVYSNLVSIKDHQWEVFQACNVRIATSFYSADSGIHESITRGHHSFEKTVGNIKHVIQLDLPLRVGLIDMDDRSSVQEAKQFLTDLGVQRIRVDQTRGVGRGEELVQVAKPEDALCGACARGRAAVIPDGRVFPCVFSRHLTLGNVHKTSLVDIMTGKRTQQTRQKLAVFFARKFATPCIPDDKGNECIPNDKRAEGIYTPCMPATEPYLKTQDLSSVLNICEPHECDPNCEPGECNPDLCQPSHTCIPDFKDPCSPVEPCSPDKESCSPEWDK